jgi:Domain of unknown function (DUF1902)
MRYEFRPLGWVALVALANYARLVVRWYTFLARDRWRRRRPRKVIVHAAYDDCAGVWYVESSSLYGLRAEADSLEALPRGFPVLSRT